jgi:hypothetical protein
MRTFAITAEPHKGKHIHVTKYVKTDTGVEIKIDHNVPATPGKELQWVQTVSSNHGFSEICKMMTRVDPFGVGGPVNTVSLPAVPGICKADDLLPFYWTAADLAAGAGPGLSDSPSVPKPATGRTWTQFVTALTEVTGTDVHHLVAIAWGYDRMADGSVRVAVIRRPTLVEMKAHGRALKRMYPDYKYT